MAQFDGREQVEIIERIPWGDPPSPWLKRYGGTEDPILRREGRSGLEPKIPNLNAFGIDDVNYEATALPRPEGAELDSLLWDEAAQLFENKGWKSWQVGAFAEGSWEDYTDTIKVEEAEWHPLFRKDRWYDLQVPLVPGDPDKGMMSIDNPLVWKDMSVVIELASRLFKLLASDGFFDAILTGLQFSEVQCVTKSKTFTKRNMMPVRATKRANVAALPGVRDKAMQRTVELASSVIISWYQDRSPQLPMFPYDAELKVHPPFGITEDAFGENNERREHVQIAASCFRAIYECDDTTQNGRTEKRLLMFLYASTIVHEMTHAVFAAHRIANNLAVERAAQAAVNEKVAQGLEMQAARDAINPLFSPEILPPFEPAIEDDNMAELGYAAEQAMFGGVVMAMPCSGTILRSCMHTLTSTYQLQLCQFPSNAIRFRGMGPHWDVESNWTLPRVDIAHVIPASHAARLLSQSYWARYSPTLGLAAVRPAKAFPAAEHLTTWVWGGQYNCNVFDQDSEQSSEAGRLGALFPTIRPEDDRGGHCEHTSNRLLGRAMLWTRMRPWYQDERERWTRTPYGHYQLRLTLRRFNHAVEMQDEMVADLQASHVTRLLNNLPRERIDAAVHAYYLLVLWAMLAALPWRPLREQETVEPDVKSWTVPNLWQPSRAAREWQAQPGNPQFVFKAEVACENVATTYWRGGLYPPVFGSMQPRAGRIGLLDLATNELEQLKDVGRLQDNVYESTLDLLNRLRNEVESKSPTYLGFLSSFTFSLPTYELAPEQPNPFSNFSSLAMDDSSSESDLIDLLSSGPVPPAQPSPQGVVGQPAGPVQGSLQNPADAQGGANAFMVSISEQEDLTRKYWSAGEVGDHGGDDGKERWVLVYNDELGGYDVFSVSAMPPRLARQVKGALQVDFNYGARVTDHGLVSQIRALQEDTFRGRLLIPRAKEEMAENDGRGSKCKWVLAGPYIYDITHFSAKDDDEHKLLWSAPHGDVLHFVLGRSGHRNLDDLQRRLYPFRCATLRRPPPTSDRTLWRPYTMREVNLHVFPQTRALTSVDGWVHDITEFADMSPLGRQKLLGLAGREVGKHIRNYFPPEWTERFLRDVAPYRIGWVVPERSAEDARLGPQEIRLRDSVYTVAVLVQNTKTQQDAELGRALSSLGGMDATDQLGQQQELSQLAKRPEFVVAMLYSKPDFEVTQEDLEAHGTLHGAMAREYGAEDDKADDQNLERYALDGSTWARIGDVVYDVSNLVNYGDDATRARVLGSAGGAITDASLIHDIQRCGVAPIIGKFVGRKPAPGVKRKWTKMARGTASGFGLGLDLPPEEGDLDERRPGFGCGCGFSRNRPQREDMDKDIHEHDLPPVDPEDLASFSYIGMDDFRKGKRMRLV